MDGERTVAALALVLGLLVLATAASGITGTQPSASGSSDAGVGVGEGQGAGAGDGNETGINLSDSGGTTGSSGEYLRALFTAFAVASLAFAALFLVLTVLREGLAGVKRLLAAAVQNAVLVGLLLGLLVVLLSLFDAIVGNGGGGIPGTGSAPNPLGGGGESASATGFPFQSLLVVAVIALALVGVLLVVASRRGLLDRSRDRIARALEDDDEADAERRTVRGPGAVTVEDVPATNAVYRTWRSLAASVASETATRTPAEVARDAVDAGLDERPVEELTTLFREARYGDEPVTEERERRARAALDALGIEERR